MKTVVFILASILCIGLQAQEKVRIVQKQEKPTVSFLEEADKRSNELDAQFEKDRIEKLREDFIHQHGLRGVENDDFIPPDTESLELLKRATDPELIQWWNEKAGRKLMAAELPPVEHTIQVFINGQWVDFKWREINDTPEPPTPIDTDGDGVTDADDPCPNDATNKCNDPPPVPSAESPTGYEPKVLWTKQRQAVYSKMVETNDPSWVYLKSIAEKAVAGKPVYADNGQYACIAYQMTGDKRYGTAALNLLMKMLATDPSGNTVRELGCELTTCLEWLRPIVKEQGKLEELVGHLDRWSLKTLGVDQPKYVGGIRTGDSDQTVGSYFLLATVDKAFADLRSADWIPYTDRSQVAPHLPIIPVGGLTPTGTGTVRDALALYAKMSEGGVWIESGGGYNVGTCTIWNLGVEAVGRENFPEYAALYPQVLNSELASYTPDHKDIFEWGDTEDRTVTHHLFYRLNLLHMLSGVLPSADAGFARGGIEKLVEANKTSIYAVPWWRAFWLINPGSTNYVADRRVDSAMGVYVRRNANELFAATFIPPTGVDHSGQDERFGDVCLWKDGEWVVDHILGYASVSVFPECGNCAMLCGLNHMYDRKSWVEGDKIIGETGGQFYTQPYYNPPPTFLRKYRREISRDGSSIVLTDTVDMDDARKLPSFDRYRAVDKDRINKAGDDLIQLVFHCPVQPTVEANAVLWKTLGGKQLKISWTDSRTVKVIDEKTLWTDAQLPAASKKWQVRLIPTEYTGGKITLNTRIEVAK